MKKSKISVSVKKKKKAHPKVEPRHCMVTIHLCLPTTGMATRTAFTAGSGRWGPVGRGAGGKGAQSAARLA